MSEKTYDVQVGGVWQSRGGKKRVKVDKIAPMYQGGSWIDVHWSGVGWRRSGTCGVHNFVANRALVERGGKAVAT